MADPQTVAELIAGGFTAESARAAAAAGDMKLLEHTGTIKVRLRPPGSAEVEPRPKPKVAVAYVHDNAGRVTSFEESLLAMRDYDAANMGVITDRITVRYGTDGLVAARNTIAARFVQTDSDWLLWVDTDMGFQPDALYRLLQVADPTERPIVGGLCFVNRENTHDGYNGYRARPVPTIYKWRDEYETGGPAGFVATPMYPVSTVMRVDATGAAFILIHRSVFERIAESVVPGLGVQVGPHWYDRTFDGAGNLMGEDISFCTRALLARIPIHVHTGVRTTHFKEFWLSEVDHWRHYVPPPAAEPVAVVIDGDPTDGFTRTLKASTGLATAYRRLEDSTEQWVVLANGDEAFRAGWLDHALHVAGTFSVPVVGLNNPADELCAAGVAATTILIRRDYLDEHGGVDIRAAQEAGEWAMALGAIVEREPAPAPRVPRYAIIPTHNRPELLTALVASLGSQCDGVVVLDNASEPPVDEEQLQDAAGVPVLVLRDEEQPPNLARFWNVMFEQVAEQAKGQGLAEWDVAVLNDDSIVPAGWFDACSTGLRGHDTAVIAHTSTTTPALLTELHNQPGNRMTPHAFVIRGELGMRADERMKWWYQDSDLDLRARLAGGVLSVKGPTVVNSKANQTTVGFLAGQAQADHAVFVEKWSR